MTNNQIQKSSGFPMADLLQGNSFMSILKNDRHNRVEIHLRGEFPCPESCTNELSELYQLSETYPTALVYVNSPGGRVDILLELHNILKKFDFVVTVCNSDACSAGFMIWSAGDVRVVDPNAELMFHREGWGYIGKTEQIVEKADFNKRRFERLMREFCEDVVTEEEMTRAQITEVWFTGQDMIDRGAAISWDQFHERDTSPMEILTVVKVNGRYYLNTSGNTGIEVDMQLASNQAVSIPSEIYLGEELQDDGTLDTPTEEDLKLSLTESLSTQEGRDELRNNLRAEYGKGNFRVGADGTVKVKVGGKWIDLIEYVLSTYEDSEED